MQYKVNKGDYIVINHGSWSDCEYAYRDTEDNIYLLNQFDVEDAIDWGSIDENNETEVHGAILEQIIDMVHYSELSILPASEETLSSIAFQIWKFN